MIAGINFHQEATLQQVAFLLPTVTSATGPRQEPASNREIAKDSTEFFAGGLLIAESTIHWMDCNSCIG